MSWNERANQLANYLRKRGVGPEVLVGVCLNRTPEMVIAPLGIWKSGGAYVPLDPAYPRERLSYMMQDSAAKFLLTSGELKNLSPSAGDKAILLDSDWNQIALENSANPKASAVPSNLAYVMYTSRNQPERTKRGHDSAQWPRQLSDVGHRRFMELRRVVLSRSTPRFPLT